MFHPPPRLPTVVASLFVLMLAPVAEASTIYTLTDSNFAGQGSFGTVTLTLGDFDGDAAADDIGVIVDLADAYVFHSNDAFGFNILGDTTGLAIGGLTSPYTVGGTTVQFNGFGTFQYGLNSVSTSTAISQFLNTMSFYVTNSAGFTSDSQLAQLNATGWLFAAQIAPIDGSTTGFAAGAAAIPAVPEPTSLAMLGLGLLGLASLGGRRRWRQRKA